MFGPETEINLITLPRRELSTFALGTDEHSAEANACVAESLPLYECWQITVKSAHGAPLLQGYLPIRAELAATAWRLMEQQYLLMAKVWIRAGSIADAEYGEAPPYPWCAAIEFPNASTEDAKFARATLLSSVREILRPAG